MTECAVESSAEVVVDSNEKKPLKVLHVDDEAGFSEIAKQCLEMQGPFQVDMATSVEEAKEKLKEETYDAVVSDYQMPGKDGLEFLKELRQSGNTVPFLIFTGRGREEVAIKALNLGADQYLNKNGDPETVYCELGHAIRTTVERKRAAEERTCAEMALRACGERYGRLFDSTIEGILINGSDGKISSLNPAAANILGYSNQKELIGTHAVKLYADPEDRTRVLRELMKNGYVKDWEMVWKKKDGILIEILASVTVQKDEKGNMLRTEGIFRDVTEKKKAEKALRESEEKYRTLANSLPEIAFEADEQGKLAFVNERTYVITGYTREDFAKGLNALDFLVPEHRGRAQENLKKVFSGEKTGTNEYTFQRKDGSTFPVLISSGPVVHEDKIVGLRGIVVDISQFKKMEMELSENQTRLQNIFDVSADAIVVIDLNGKVADCNEQAQKVFGYSSKSEFVGRNAFESAAKKDWQRAMENMERTLKQGLMRNIEYTIIAKNGSERLLSVSASVLKDLSGNPTGFVSVIEDITERKKAEEALRESEEKFRNLAEQSPNMIFINKKGRIVYANKKSEEIMGYTKEEFYSPDFNFLKLIAPESRELIKSDFAKHMKGEEAAPYEYKLLTRQGRTIDAILTSKLITYDGESAILGTVTDISERRQEHEVVRRSAEQARSLLEFQNKVIDTAIVWINLLDREGNVILWNRAAELISGYSREEVIGHKKIWEWLYPDPQYCAKIFAHQRRTIEHNESAFRDFETVIRCKDGALKTISWYSNNILDENGETVGSIAMGIDATELKKTEKDLQEAIERLAIMNEKLRVVGLLSRHDVRNKLQLVALKAYLAKRELPAESKVVEDLAAIEKAVQQSVEIFDFARVYEMLGSEELVYVDVEKTVSEAALLFLDLKGVNVVNECRGLTVLADSLLRQLFYNLIDNSLKYGQKVTRIKVHYERTSQDALKLVFEDDGVGIPIAEKPKLFKEGYSTGGSTGYGLYLIKKMMEVYGWTIQETGEPGKGAQFTMTIPETNQSGKEDYRIA
ncbi:MAG: PAS domain S-box protein [Candidatus Bathyarchaeia archaeon]